MRENIKIYELIVFSLCSAVFATALVVIVPFVDVYTSGVVDADYHQPLFAVIFVLATMFLCFRIPYETVLKAAGAVFGVSVLLTLVVDWLFYRDDCRRLVRKLGALRK